MACHEENPYGKFFGTCNDFKLALDSCFKVRWSQKCEKDAEKRREQERLVLHVLLHLLLLGLRTLLKLAGVLLDRKTV